jgi:transposase
MGNEVSAMDQEQGSSAGEKKPRRPKRKFTPEFKREAVRLVLDEGKTVGKVAKDLDLTDSGLRVWVEREKIERGQGKPGALNAAERAELARLRKENRILQMEREILKKAAAFFAKESK